MSTPVNEPSKLRGYSEAFAKTRKQALSCSSLNEVRATVNHLPMWEQLEIAREWAQPEIQATKDLMEELKSADACTYKVPPITWEECVEDVSSDSSLGCSEELPVLTLKECEEHGKRLDDTVQRMTQVCVDWAAHGNGCADNSVLSGEDDVRALAWVVQKRGPGFKLAENRLAEIILAIASSMKVCLSCGIPADSDGHLLCRCLVEKAEKERVIRSEQDITAIWEAGLGGTVVVHPFWIASITGVHEVGNSNSLSGLNLSPMSDESDGSTTSEVMWGSL